MALTQCIECKHAVSTRAIVCPACGCPGPATSTDGGRVGASPATALVDAGLLGKIAYVLGAWAVAPHIERTISIVAFCVMASVASYFLFGSRHC